MVVVRNCLSWKRHSRGAREMAGTDQAVSETDARHSFLRFASLGNTSTVLITTIIGMMI